MLVAGLVILFLCPSPLNLLGNVLTIPPLSMGVLKYVQLEFVLLLRHLYSSCERLRDSIQGPRGL